MKDPNGMSIEDEDFAEEAREEEASARALPPVEGSVFPRRSGRVVARFSCGAASAVATKLAIEKYGDAVEIYYNDTGSEHPDNTRFISDCERWFGRKVNILRSEEFTDTWAVWESRRYLVNHLGAPCTGALKQRPGDSIIRIGDVEIYGYTIDEKHRVEKWQRHNKERILECPLIERELTKEDCFGVLDGVGIELPAMYRLGFANNNCIACVKARDSVNYWKRIRKHFPSHFDRMAKLERELRFQINRVTVKRKRSPIYLDEIPAGDPTGPDEVKISCGLFCMAEVRALNTQNSD